MPIQTLNIIKNWFKTGFKPTQAQFWDTWDSFRHKFEKIPVKDVEGIDELLLSKADKAVLNDHLADKNAHAPQVNTDWNSESGLSQLLNKPEFKTINGEEIEGSGDMAISGSQNLQQTFDNGSDAQLPNGEVFNVRVGTENMSQIYIKDAGSLTDPAIQLISDNGKILLFGKNFELQTGGFGSISTGVNNSKSMIMIDGQSQSGISIDGDGITLKGRNSGIQLEGQGKAVTLSGAGQKGIQMLSTMAARQIMNIDSSNLDIQSDTNLNLSSSKKTKIGSNGDAVTMEFFINEGSPSATLNSYGDIIIKASKALDISAGTDDIVHGVKINGKNAVRTVNGVGADILGNVIMLGSGDMTTNTNQEISGIKTFLSGKLALRNATNTFSSFLSNSNTDSRTYFFQDTSGTLMLSDAGNSNLTGYGQAVQLLSSNGTPIRGGNVVNLFSFVQATPVTINKATLHSVLTGTIFGNTTLVSSTDLDNPMLTMGKSFSGKMFGHISAISAATLNTVLKVGSTTLLDSNSVVIPLTILNKSFEINYSFAVISEGTTGTMIANLSVLIDGMSIYSLAGDLITIDTTINRIFDIQFAYGEVNAVNTITFISVKGGNDVN